MRPRPAHHVQQDLLAALRALCLLHLLLLVALQHGVNLLLVALAQLSHLWHMARPASTQPWAGGALGAQHVAPRGWQRGGGDGWRRTLRLVLRPSCPAQACPQARVPCPAPCSTSQKCRAGSVRSWKQRAAMPRQAHPPAAAGRRPRAMRAWPAAARCASAGRPAGTPARPEGRRARRVAKPSGSNQTGRAGRQSRARHILLCARQCAAQGTPVAAGVPSCQGPTWRIRFMRASYASCASLGLCSSGDGEFMPGVSETICHVHP